MELPGWLRAEDRGRSSVARRQKLEEMATRNGQWFDVEIEKLEQWAEDRRATLKAELDELDEALKTARKKRAHGPNLPEKLERQRKSESWRASATKPGAPSNRLRAISKSRRTRCWMR